MPARKTFCSALRAVLYAGLAALLIGPPGRASSSPPDGGRSPFVEIARRVQPAVVSISVSKPRGYEFAWGQGQVGRRRQSPATLRYGSGVIIDAQGHVLTNNHVVDEAIRIQVSLSGSGSEYPAEIIGQDPESDLALIRILSSRPVDSDRVAHLGNSDSILVGDWVMAFGSPFGFRHTVSVGVISAKGRHLDKIEGDVPSFQDFLQTDAPINPGNSGGPLVDMNGRVVGINTAYNPGGSGIGFAIPINLAVKVSAELRKHGEVIRGYLGIYPQDLTYDIAEALGLASFQGVLIGEVQPGSPAETGGLERGDVILRMDGHPVTDAGDFLNRVADYPPETRLELVILRNQTRHTFTVALGRRQPGARFADPAFVDAPGVDWPGLEVENRWSLESRRLGISKNGRGVAVTYIAPGSPAEQKEIVRGDIILEIDGSEILNVDDYQRAIEQLRKQTRPGLFLIHEKDRGHTRYIALRPPQEP